MNATGKQTCPGCGKEIDPIYFTCPTCGAVQPAGELPMVPKPPTTIVAGAAAGTATQPKTVVVRDAETGPQSIIDVAVVTFNNDARVIMSLSPVEKAGPIEIEPEGCTNGAAALKKAYDILHGDPSRIYRRSTVVVLSDGEFNEGGRKLLVFGDDPAEAAIKCSKELKDKGTRVGTILFAGNESARGTLKKVASSPALFMEAGSGQLMRAMLSLTRTMTQAAGAAAGSTVPGTAVVFLIDASGSMGEGSKKAEAERAYMACIEDLRSI